MAAGKDRHLVARDAIVAENSKIEWTDATWNVITGCSIKSPGCTNCYAMQLAGTRLKNHPSRAGLTQEVNGHHVWTGEVRFNERWLDQPLRWTAPRDIFVVAHGDLAHEDVPDAWLDSMFAVIALASHHRYQIVTKRPERLLRYLADPKTYQRVLNAARPLRAKRPRRLDGGISNPSAGWRHVIIMTSVEDQKRADERLDAMRQISWLGWRTGVSYEPAIGPVNWAGWEFIKWMISGGESGPRPSHPDWHRVTRDWCGLNSVPYYFKQWGSWAPHLDRERDDPDWRGDYTGMKRSDQFKFLNLAGGCGFHGDRLHVMKRIGKKAAGATLDGREHKEMPAHV